MPTRASVRAALRVPDMNQCRSCYDICDDKDFDFATGRCKPCQADRNARGYDADQYTKADYLADRRKDDEADRRDREMIDAMANAGGKAHARQDRRMDEIAERKETDESR